MKPLKSAGIAATLMLAVAALAPLPAAARDARHSKETVMTSAADRWGKAFNARDLDALVALYTDDAELLPKGTQAIGGQAAIRDYLGQLMASTPTTQRTVFTNVQTFGTGDAISEVADVEIEDAQGRRTVLGRQILILLKRDGEWKVHRDMWTNNDKPAS